MIPILSVAFFSSCIANCHSPGFSMLDIDKCVFYSVLQKITIFRTGFLVHFCFLSKPAFHTSNITEKALKKMKIIGLNPNFSVCCLFWGDFFVFVAVIVMT